ncbi:MAG: LysR family transcriptional regulator [Pseudomonadota bacterium]
MSKRSSKTGLPPLDWLRVFEAAGRLGGFSAAAQELGLTQAAVSQHMKNLETWLGRALFLRRARGVSLTVEGESYLPLVRDALRALSEGTEDLFGQSPTELRVAGLSSHLEALVIPRIEPFLKAHPAVRLVTDSIPRRSDFDLEKTTLQVRFGRGAWPGRTAVLLHREILAPMAPPGTKEARWRDLPAIEIRGERPGWRDWARESGSRAPSGASLSVDSMAQGLSAASYGQGVVLGSTVLARSHLMVGQVKALALPALPTADGYWLTWPDGELRSVKHKRLVLDLKDALSTD